MIVTRAGQFFSFRFSPDSRQYFSFAFVRPGVVLVLFVSSQWTRAARLSLFTRHVPDSDHTAKFRCVFLPRQPSGSPHATRKRQGYDDLGPVTEVSPSRSVFLLCFSAR